MSIKYEPGFTLVEMIIAIVIIGVGLAGVLLAFNTNVKASADPLVRKQMLAIAEEMMEEVLLKPYPLGGATSANSGPVNCGTTAASRKAFDNVDDYGGYSTKGVCDIDGEPVDDDRLGSYRVAVAIDSSASLGDVASGGALSGGEVKKIGVTVSHSSGQSLTLTGWRTKFAL